MASCTTIGELLFYFIFFKDKQPRFKRLAFQTIFLQHPVKSTLKIQPVVQFWVSSTLMPIKKHDTYPLLGANGKLTFRFLKISGKYQSYTSCILKQNWETNISQIQELHNNENRK